MDSGLLVVLFVATLVVVAPSVLLLRVWWRRGGFARAVAIAGTSLIALLAFVLFGSPGWPDSREERLVLFMAAWGTVFSLLGVAALAVLCFRHAFEYLRNSRAR